MWSARSLTPMNNAWANEITEATLVKIVNDLRFGLKLEETFGVIAYRRNSIVQLWCKIKIHPVEQFDVSKNGVPQGSIVGPSLFHADVRVGLTCFYSTTFSLCTAFLLLLITLLFPSFACLQVTFYRPCFHPHSAPSRAACRPSWWTTSQLICMLWRKAPWERLRMSALTCAQL